MTFSLSGLPAFEYYQPTSIRDALQSMRENPSAKVYLGGTDLFPRMRKQVLTTDVLIDLKWINDFTDTMITQAGDLIISPLATYSHLLPYLGEINGGEVLTHAIEQLGTRSLRNRATLAGNLCNASPAADSIAALLVYEASLTLRSLDGVREIPVSSFYCGPGKTILRSDELLTGIRIPAQHAQCKGTYIKLSRNKAADLAICGVAVLGYPDPEKQTGLSFRIAVSGANAVPLLVPQAKEYLENEGIELINLQTASRMAAGAVSPVSDVRSSADYRKEMVYQLTLQALINTMQKFGMGEGS